MGFGIAALAIFGMVILLCMLADHKFQIQIDFEGNDDWQDLEGGDYVHGGEAIETALVLSRDKTMYPNLRVQSPVGTTLFVC